MKLMMALFLVLTTTSVFANSVKITSFFYTRDSETVAELCGVVEGTLTGTSYIKVAVDPGTRRAGTYNTVAGTDGKFCVLLVTYNGRAEVSLFGDKKVSIANLK